jgi:hypothetical protein
MRHAYKYLILSVVTYFIAYNSTAQIIPDTIISTDDSLFCIKYGKIKIRGTAFNEMKSAPTIDPKKYWSYSVYGLNEWPENVVGKKIKITGVECICEEHVEYKGSSRIRQRTWAYLIDDKFITPQFRENDYTYKVVSLFRTKQYRQFQKKRAKEQVE